VIFAFQTIKLFDGTSGDSLNINKTEKGIIGVVEVEGIILESKKIIDMLHQAHRSNEIAAIIVRINSPGGAVGPSQEIYEEIRKIDSDPEKGKPVFASFSTLAASGGYYIGAAARKIYANPGTLTGSIGVIMEFLDLSQLYKFAKVNPETIKSGKYKDAGISTRPLTETERKMLRELLEEVHQQFISDVRDLRSEKIKGKLEDLAEGQIFSGKQAFEQGLVDELAGLWEAGRRIHKELGLKGEFQLKFIKKKKKYPFFDFIEEIESKWNGILEGLTGARIPMALYPRWGD
jgi:protease IV